MALDQAAAMVMVVDGRTELPAPDLELARLLIRSGKALFLAINKIDTEKQGALSGEFHHLGIRNVFPISAENGNGLDDLSRCHLCCRSCGGGRCLRGNT